jgi:O-antigen ligase
VKSIVTRFLIISVATTIAVCLLLADLFSKPSAGWSYRVGRDVRAVRADPIAQSIVVMGLAVDLAALWLMQRRGTPCSSRGRPGKSKPWLWICVGLALLGWAKSMPAASEAAPVLFLLVGVLAGEGIALLAGKAGDAMETAYRRRWFLGLLTLFLSAAAFCQTADSIDYLYAGVRRWTGLWENPNTYGVLMGVGVVLAAGLCMCFSNTGGGYVVELDDRARKERVVSRALGAAVKVDCRIGTTLCLAAATMCVIGLLKSCSRGAWVATLLALFYLVWQIFMLPSAVESARCRAEQVLTRRDRRDFSNDVAARAVIPMGIALVAAAVIAFWHCRGTDRVPLRRIVSVANTRDFSWRNRLAAWEGAFQMIAERPLLGFGWNRPEPMYDAYFRPKNLSEGLAVQLNDYLMLGATLGIPALFCFGMYMWLALTQKWPSIDLEWPKTICRAGAIVLAVGFWFDGGLFRLATASTFWILLELGRET